MRSNPALKAMGTFKAETLPIAALGKNPPTRRRSSTAPAGNERVSHQLQVTRARRLCAASSCTPVPPPGPCAPASISGTRPTATIASAAATLRRAARPSRACRSACQRIEIERPHHKRGRQFFHHVDEHQQQRRGARCAEQRRVHAHAACDRPDAQAACRFVHAGVMRANPASMPFQRDGEEAHEIGIDQRGHGAGQQQPGMRRNARRPGRRQHCRDAPSGTRMPTAITAPGTA